MDITVRGRVAALAGAGYVALALVGNGLNTAGTHQSGHPTGAQVIADLHHQAASGTAKVGLVLELLGFVSLMVFVGFLAGFLQRSVARTAAGTTVVAGLTFLAVKLGSAGPGIALHQDRDAVSPQLARVLDDIGGGMFVLSWVPFALFVGAAGVALRGAGAIGRVTAYLGVGLGVAGVVLGAVGLLDPAGANAVAFLLALLWLLVVSVRLAVRPGPGAPVTTAPERVAVPV